MSINFYQICIRTVMKPCCRFEPSCSEYSKICFARFGLCKGGWLSLTRILRCNPWGRWGYDPVPEVKLKTETK